MQKSVFLGLVTMLVLGTLFTAAHANSKCLGGGNPLRGIWSFSQFAPFVGAPGADPVPLTEIGNLIMDQCGNYTGSAFLNAPNFTGPLSFDGRCGNPNNSAGLLTCTVNSAEFGLVGAIRECVASAKKGRCFDKFSCVAGDAAVEPDSVLIAEFTRQHTGTCQ